MRKLVALLTTTIDRAVSRRFQGDIRLCAIQSLRRDSLSGGLILELIAMSRAASPETPGAVFLSPPRRRRLAPDGSQQRMVSSLCYPRRHPAPEHGGAWRAAYFLQKLRRYATRAWI